MFKPFKIVSSTLIVGGVVTFLYKKYNDDIFNSLMNLYVISINRKKIQLNDSETQTICIKDPSLNKMTQTDSELIKNNTDELIKITPEKYKWYFI
tara:strand:+ start:351 stop:635 length:285 start_codon:yes stop_codon:yes gene_type:complete